MNLHIHGHQPRSAALRESFIAQAEELEADFPNLIDCDLSLENTGRGFHSRVRLLGRGLTISAHAECGEIDEAVRLAFARAYRQLRKRRDRTIYSRRREARREHHAI